MVSGGDDSMVMSTEEVAPETSTMECIEAAFRISDATLEEAPQILEALYGLNVEPFDNIYRLEKRLRSGSFGTVYECQHVSHPDQLYAVKIIDRKKLKPKDDKAVFTEVAVLRECHEIDNVIKIIDFFVEPDKLYMVQMLARGGDVFDRLTARQKYSERDARNLAVTLIKTMYEIHKKTIVHRDLKPENLLLQEELNDTSILVADFGFAKHCGSGQYLKTRCGTPAFVAPEIVLGTPYNASCDMWSIGCLLYMIICGYPPFQGKDHNDLFRKIRASDFTFHDKYWKKVSLPAKQLIAGLLTVNAKNRLTGKQACESSWIQKLPDEALGNTDLTGALREMKKFKAREKLKSAMGAVRWVATANFWVGGNISFSQHKSRQSMTVPAGGSAAPGGAGGAGGGGAAAGRQSGKLAEIQQATFRDRYELVTKIRKGSFATVWECHHKVTKEKFAAKVIKRAGLSADDDEAVLNEVTIMQSLSRHGKYVTQLCDFYEEKDYFFMVMELMAGGDVFDQIVERTSYTEKDARDLVKTLLTAVKCLHENGIAHRDIKPQNLLLPSKQAAANIKLCDFGFARRVHTPQSITHRVGTPTYVAPEVLKNIPHDERVDMWSVGVTMHVLLVGYAPFMEDDQLKLFSKIKRGEWRFHRPDWRHISEDAKDLIRALLVIDPVERMTVDEALRCPWLTQDNDEDLSNNSLNGSISNLMSKRQKLRSVAKTVLFMGKIGAKFGNNSASSDGNIAEVVTVDKDNNTVEFDKQ
ncbi:MAP kinase-activated protein kinase 2 (Fragment) [Seminavis robusta]|uniref:MAP kinase-activated protein kinase 2 n=1 Tax=Seminavis robusta TaxID=568900 RepID=A0A9N8HIN4_9STRA